MVYRSHVVLLYNTVLLYPLMFNEECSLWLQNILLLKREATLNAKHILYEFLSRFHGGSES